jgi:hypothetical protein
VLKGKDEVEEEEQKKEVKEENIKQREDNDKET